MPESLTYVVLLNYNNWRDTVACLSSLFHTCAARIRVVVCDNASSDGSLARIKQWADGHCDVADLGHPRLNALVQSHDQGIRHVVLNSEFLATDRSRHEGVPLVLIDNGCNGGFAAGCNVGMRFALQQPDMTHVWLLNNDTVVEPDCLAAMHRRLARSASDAVCGSMIHFFDQPEMIQAVGGNRFNRFTGAAACSEGRFLSEHQDIDIERIEAELDYLSGCSMLLPRRFLDQVGLMSEDYFLYYEEIDWFTRASGAYDCRIARDARLYHREGGSIGSPGLDRPTPSLLADKHIFRSKHIFMARYYKQRLIWCYLHTAIEGLKRVLKGQFSNARTVFSVLSERATAG